MLNADMKLSRFFTRCVFVIAAVFVWQHAGARQQPAVKEEVDKLIATGMKFLVVPDSLIKYAEPAHRLAISGNYRFGEAMALKLKGIYEFRKGNPDQAIVCYQAGLAICQELNNELETGKANLNIATAYQLKSDFVKSTRYGLEALRIFERLNERNGQGRVLNLLGISAHSQQDYRAAKSFFLQYNAFAKQARDSIEIASSYNNLGSTYKALKMPDSAAYFLNLAGRIQKQKNNAIGVGNVYENIGNIYMDVKQDYRGAIAQYRKSAEAYRSIGADQQLGHVYSNIGVAYGKLGDTITAKKYLKEAIILANKAGDKRILQNSYQWLSELDAGNERYRAAYNSLLTSRSHSDSIWTREKVKAVEELKTQYNTEKKEMKIRSLAQQNTIQDLQIRQRNYWLGAGAFLLVAGGLIAYLLYSRQQFRNRVRLQTQLAESRETAARAVIDAEERERQRIASDLHDGVGQLLSSALLSLNTLLKKVPIAANERPQAERTVALVTESYNEVRSISHQMVPNALLKSGLVASVRDFLDTLNSDELAVSLSVSGMSDPLNEQTETFVYRILQEAVNNVVKSARASKLNVQLVKDAEGLQLSVEDNGAGFNVNAAKAKGMGLQNIATRVNFLKGTLDIDSAPGRGTVMVIWIPV